MARQPRELRPGYSYHVTTRCNNREFRLTRLECREVLLYTVRQAKQKYDFKLYALCIMHYEQSCSLSAGTSTTGRFAQNHALD